MASFRQVNVRCPFYLDDDGKSRIVCEGLVDGSRIALEYRKKEDFKIQTAPFAVDGM